MFCRRKPVVMPDIDALDKIEFANDQRHVTCFVNGHAYFVEKATFGKSHGVRVTNVRLQQVVAIVFMKSTPAIKNKVQFDLASCLAHKKGTVCVIDDEPYKLVLIDNTDNLYVIQDL